MNDDPTMPDDDDARALIALLANGLKIGTCGLPK